MRKFLPGRNESLLILALAFAAGAHAKDRPDREAVHQAMEACRTENNLAKLERGQRPSDEDRAKMDACLKSKGIEHPHGPPPDGFGRGERPPPPEVERYSNGGSGEGGGMQ